MDPSTDPSIPPIVPRHDLGRQLRQWTAGTADVDEHMGGFRLRVTDTAGFPWAVVFASLLRHEFRVYVNRRDAALVIEASA